MTLLEPVRQVPNSPRYRSVHELFEGILTLPRFTRYYYAKERDQFLEELMPLELCKQFETWLPAHSEVSRWLSVDQYRTARKASLIIHVICRSRNCLKVTRRVILVLYGIKQDIITVKTTAVPDKESVLPESIFDARHMLCGIVRSTVLNLAAEART